jgi:hypothetical protein
VGRAKCDAGESCGGEGGGEDLGPSSEVEVSLRSPFPTYDLSFDPEAGDVRQENQGRRANGVS